jgi:hypothetical protein
MNCQQIESELSAYLDGELSGPLLAEVEQHVAGCASCQARVGELRKIVAGVSALPKIRPSPQFLTDVRRKIARGERPNERTWFDTLFEPVWLKVPLEAVALIAILVAVGVLTRPISRPEGPAMPARGVAGKEAAETAVPSTERNELPSSSELPVESAPAAPQEMGRLEPARRDQGEYRAIGQGEGDDLMKSPARERVDVLGTHADSRDKEGIVAMFANKPAETIVVESANAVEVQTRAELIAVDLKGKVTPLEQSADRVQSFQVELPPEAVALFKTKFAAVTEEPKPGAKMSVEELKLQPPSAPAVAAELKDETAARAAVPAAPPTYKLAEKAQTSDSMTRTGAQVATGTGTHGGLPSAAILEIQVIAPGP